MTEFSRWLHFKGHHVQMKTPDVIHLLLQTSLYITSATLLFFLDIHREQRRGAGAPSNEQRSGLPQRPAISLFQRHRWLAANPGIDQLC